MMKFVLYGVFGIVLFVLFVRYLERTSVFYPEKDLLATPEDIGLDFEDTYFVTDDHVRLHGWFIKNETAKSTILIFHGNAGNIGGRLSTIEFYHQLGLNIFIIDYRGYGNSQGRPTEKGLYLDAKAAYQYLTTKRNILAENIIVYGASLGGAAAIDLVSRNMVGGIVIDSSFSSAKDMAKLIYPFIPSFMIFLDFDNVKKVATIKAPKLFIHSIDDQTIPFKLGKKLFDAAAQPKILVEVSGVHDEIRKQDDSEIVRDSLHRFLKTYNLL